jgi:hypothetical protein
MPPPISFLQRRIFFKYFGRCPALNPTHDLRRRYIGWSRNQNMDVIFTDNSSENPYLKPLAYLPNQFSYAQRNISLKYLITIFRHKYKMILYLIRRVAPLAIFHPLILMQPLPNTM